jgi:hypothetical protein
MKKEHFWVEEHVLIEGLVFTGEGHVGIEDPVFITEKHHWPAFSRDEYSIFGLKHRVSHERSIFCSKNRFLPIEEHV